MIPPWIFYDPRKFNIEHNFLFDPLNRQVAVHFIFAFANFLDRVCGKVYLFEMPCVKKVSALQMLIPFGVTCINRCRVEPEIDLSAQEIFAWSKDACVVVCKHTP